MANFLKEPLKIYIQDIFRAKQIEENRYFYELFGLQFKNIMIHGVITSVYNKIDKSINFELCDPTGCIQSYYDLKKNNNKISDDTIKDLIKNFSRTSRSSDVNILTMSSLLDCIENNYKNPMNLDVGSHVSVIGDIFVDNLTNNRTVCVYSCKETSIDRDVIWLEELKYLYEKFYLLNNGS